MSKGGQYAARRCEYKKIARAYKGEISKSEKANEKLHMTFELANLYVTDRPTWQSVLVCG